MVLCLAPERIPRRAGRPRALAARWSAARARRSSFWQMYDADSSRPSRCAPHARGRRAHHLPLGRAVRSRLAAPQPLPGRTEGGPPSRARAARPPRAHAAGRGRGPLDPGARSIASDQRHDGSAPVARRQRSPAQARERLARREAVVHRVSAGLRAAHADHASTRPVLRGPVPLPARRPALRLLRGLRRDLRARRDLLPRDRRARTPLLAAARPAAGLPPLVSLRVRGGRRRLHAARDRGAPDGRALPSSAVPGRMDARAGPPERRHGDGRHAAAPRGQVVALRRARRRRRPPGRRALPVLLRLPARASGSRIP